MLGRTEVVIRQANRYLDTGDVETAKKRLREARDLLRDLRPPYIGLDSEEQKIKDALVGAFYETLERLPDGVLDGLHGGIPYTKKPRPPKPAHCTETGCKKPVLAKGLCKTHYHRIYWHGRKKS